MISITAGSEEYVSACMTNIVHDERYIHSCRTFSHMQPRFSAGTETRFPSLTGHRVPRKRSRNYLTC